MNTRINLRLIDLLPNQVNLITGPTNSFKTRFLLNALLELPLNYPNAVGHQPRPADQCIPVTLVIGEMNLADVYHYLNTALDSKFRRSSDPQNDIHRYFQCYGYILDVIGVSVDDVPLDTLVDLTQRNDGGVVFVDGISTPDLYARISDVCQQNQITVLGTTSLATPTSASDMEEVIAATAQHDANQYATLTALSLDHTTAPEDPLLRVATGSIVRTLPVAPLTTQFWVTAPMGSLSRM